MHIIIVGCGRVGSQLALMLAHEGHDIVVIDKRSSAFKRLGSAFNGITLTGIGFDPELLKQAGIEQAKAVLALTNGDNSNIMIGQIAKRLFKVPSVISRIYDPERAAIYADRYDLDTLCTSVIQTNIVRDCLFGKKTQHEFNFGKDQKIKLGLEIV